VKLPEGDRAIIDAEKLRDYLLSPSHPVGRFKAAFFASLGYTQANWTKFWIDLRRQHLTKDAVFRHEISHGKKYEIRGKIEGPTGKASEVISIWIVLVGETVPRFVTAYPGERR